MEILAEQAAVNVAYQLADKLPGVREERFEIRQAAEQLLETRREAYESTGALPYQPVDALSTAHSVLEMGFRYGDDSKEYTQHYDGLVLDCQRLVGEWYRKKRPEYFAPVRHVFDATREEFFSHGLSIRQMTENALTPLAGNEEEEQRRINERVEDATPHIMRRLGALAIGDQAVRTISECTDKAITDYQDDMQSGRAHQGYSGYVPEIQKVMIRNIRLDAESHDRFEEQIGLPGTYITHEIFQLALSMRGIAEAEQMDKTTLHGSQIVANDDLLDFVEHLDQIGTQEWSLNSIGQKLFMGEAVAISHPANYESFRQEALERQDSLKNVAATTVEFVLDLAEQNFDRIKAPAHVEEFVKKQLLQLAKADQVVAEQMFDTKTAVGLQEVARLENMGRFNEAQILMESVEKIAPGGGFCGAGSCGLEGVNAFSDEGRSLAKKLNASDSDTIVKDTERACRCGQKSIVYAYNKNKVNKYCESCGAFESKATKG